MCRLPKWEEPFLKVHGMYVVHYLENLVRNAVPVRGAMINRQAMIGMKAKLPKMSVEQHAEMIWFMEFRF